MVVLQEVTEQRRAEALAALDQAKTAFFSNVSHELRMPLTLLLGPLQDLLSGSADVTEPEVREQLELAHRNGKRLLKLVNMLLDLARLEAGHLKTVRGPTDLATLTIDLARAFRPVVERAGLRLTVACPSLPEPIYVDRDQWEQIVLNLLSNAFKFTLTGEIAVTLSMRDERVVLTVRDTGLGIPPEELPRLFERFHRVRQPAARTHEGTGIGLALVQELVELHGGTVQVNSMVGDGTTFTVSIPRGVPDLPADRITSDAPDASMARVASYVEEIGHWLPDAPPSPLDAAEPGDPSEPRHARAPATLTGVLDGPARLLVVDDDAETRAYLGQLLRGHGEVKLVGDGRAALDLIRIWQPDLIVTD